jgi:hypothetical protein
MASEARPRLVKRLPRLLSARALSGSSSKERSSRSTADSDSPVWPRSCASRRRLAASRGASSTTRRHTEIASAWRPDVLRISASSRCVLASLGSSSMAALHRVSACGWRPPCQQFRAWAKRCFGTSMTPTRGSADDRIEHKTIGDTVQPLPQADRPRHRSRGFFKVKHARCRLRRRGDAQIGCVRAWRPRPMFNEELSSTLRRCRIGH